MPLTDAELAKLLPQLAPHGIYVTGDDFLLITSINSVASVRLALGGRMVQADGRPHHFADSHVATADRVAATSTMRLGEGWLQELTIGVTGATPQFGQTFVRVDLVRGDGPGRTAHGTLIQGPLTAVQRSAWPGSPLEFTLGLPGALRSRAGTDPAAGADVSETVPTGARWRFLSLRVVLVTDGTAANRTPNLVFDDGTTVFAMAAPNFNMAASLTFQYHFVASGVTHVHTSASGQVAAPANLILPAGFRIRTSTGSIQAGDNFGAPQLLVEEWLEG